MESSDALCWHPTPSGEFSVSSAYALSLPYLDHPHDGIWKHI